MGVGERTIVALLSTTATMAETRREVARRLSRRSEHIRTHAITRISVRTLLNEEKGENITAIKSSSLVIHRS